MKVFHVLPELNFGGVESHRVTIAKYSANHEKLDNLFCAIGNGGAAERALRDLGCRVLCLREDVQIPNFRAIVKLYRLMRSQRPDIVHTSVSEANFHGLLAAWLARVPVRIGEQVGIPPLSRRAKLVFPKIFATAHCVIAVSRAVMDCLVDHAFVQRDKTYLLYNPCDTEGFSDAYEQRVMHDGFIVTTVCRLVAEKNLRLLITAFAAVAKDYPDMRLWIVGDGPLRGDLEELAGRLIARGQVVFWGFRNDVRALLAATDLFVISSSQEGLPIALVEAMSMGLPAIGTSAGGIPEVITPNAQVGWLVGSGGAGEMSEKIAQVYCLPREERQRMGEKARLYVQEKFSPRTYMQRLMALYEKHLFS